MRTFASGFPERSYSELNAMLLLPPLTALAWFTLRCSRAVALSLLIVLCGACAGLPEASGYIKSPSQFITNTQDTRLGQTLAEWSLEADGDSGFFALGEGMRAFVARWALIQAADRSLDLQYYIWHADTSGQLLAYALLHAADRGVRVRLLLDDLDTAGKDGFLSQFDAHPNIEVRLYNPFTYRGSRSVGFATDLGRLNHRMHNKSLTADNQLTVVGGRNIGDEYFDAGGQTAFSDLDVLAVGPVVNDVSVMFDRYWNSDAAVPMAAFSRSELLEQERLLASRQAFELLNKSALASDYVKAIEASTLLDNLLLQQLDFEWGNATLIYDNPDKPTAQAISA